jgi:thiamine kinase-like enzyme
MANFLKFIFFPFFVLALHAEEIKDVEEFIGAVLNDSGKYPKRLLELGATNTNYEVVKEGKSYFFRLSANLLKELYANQEIEYRVLKELEKKGIVPCPYFFDPKRGILITEYIDHDGVAVDLLDPDVQKVVCEILKSIERDKIELQRTFDPYQDILALIKKASTPLPIGVGESVLPTLKKISEQLDKYPKKTLCHLDLHHKNILQKGDSLFLIDWEYAAMSHPYHTLASMASIERWSDEQMWQILGNYTLNPTIEDRECLYLYRIISDLFWAVWCHIQMENPSTNSPYTEWRDLFSEAAKERIRQFEKDLKQTEIVCA